MNQDQKHRIMLNTDFRVDLGCWGVSLSTLLWTFVSLIVLSGNLISIFLLIVQYANQVFPTEKPNVYLLCVYRRLWPCISHQVYFACINTYWRLHCLPTVGYCICSTEALCRCINVIPFLKTLYLRRFSTFSSSLYFQSCSFQLIFIAVRPVEQTKCNDYASDKLIILTEMSSPG